MVPERRVIQKTSKAIVEQTRAYLQQEMGGVVTMAEPYITDSDVLVLRHMTVVVGLGGPIAVLVAFSFDQPLAEHMYKVETDGLEQTPEQEELYAREAVAETVNVILGHSTTALAEKDNDVILSPPILIEGTKKIFRPCDSVFVTVTVSTNQGVVDINFAYPKEMFDEHLNVIR